MNLQSVTNTASTCCLFLYQMYSKQKRRLQDSSSTLRFLLQRIDSKVLSRSGISLDVCMYDDQMMVMYRQIFVYIFCLIIICTLIFTPATKSLVLNIERALQN